MQWRDVYTVSFLILSNSVMGFSHGWHRHWGGFHHNHDSSSRENSYTRDHNIKETHMNVPDSNEMNYPDFLPYHTDNWKDWHRDHKFSRNEGSFSQHGISKETDISNSGPHFFPHHMHGVHHGHHGHHYHNWQDYNHTGFYDNFYKTSTTTQPTTETTTKPTTEAITKPTTDPRVNRIIKPTRSTTQVTIETTTDFNQNIVNCIQFCPVTAEYNPVCGTNLVTYPNPGRLFCAKRCGLAVDLLIASPCPKPNNAKIITTSESTSTTSTTTAIVSETNMNTLFLETCMKNCDGSTELRPVCGSNSVTYKNTRQILCAQYCGVDVKIIKFAQCVDGSNEPTSSTTPKSMEIVSDLGKKSYLPLYQQYCIKGCPVTSEHNPVCGTNDVTYKNPSVLQCFITCGIYVQLKHTSACVNKNDNNNDQQLPSVTSAPVQTTVSLPPHFRLCIKSCPTLEEVKQICGTNGVTYKNPSHMQCAKVCGARLEMKHRGPCLAQDKNTGQAVTTNRPVATQSTTTPNKPNQEICSDKCVKNTEYKPVCGSNNVTYRNIDELQCAISCNVNVTLETFSACSVSSVLPENTTREIHVNVITTSTTTAPEITKKSSTYVQIGTTESYIPDIDPRFKITA